MLGFGQSSAPAGGDDLIKESSEATFMEDVVDASMHVPVLVDFWATWCGPCKQLTPALEAAVREAKGAVKLVKVDVDQNQVIAQQMRIQSIPTVFAFWQGQPVDGFQGALPGSKIKLFIEKLVKMAGTGQDDGLDAALAQAEELLEQGAAVEAAQLFAAVLQQLPENAQAYAGMVRAYLAMGELDRAEGMLTTAPEAIFAAPELEAVRAQLALARQAADAGPLADLEAAVAADPGNHQARFDLATALQAAGKSEAAVDQLLELFRRDREWNDGAAKAQLFTIFEAMKPTDPVVLKGRRKLSSMIFA